VAENFLGGQMRLFPARADRAIAGLARAMKSDAVTAARGVIRVVNANMERALRVITVERGFDPRDFTLMAFGGAGPMHACELALDLGIRKIVLPRNPGLLCAWGALGAPLGREYSITVRETAPKLEQLLKQARPMIARASAELRAHGAEKSAIKIDLRADVRYRGQSYEIEVQLGPKFAADFHQAHRQTFGYAAPDSPIEVVNLRLRASAAGPAIKPARIANATGKPIPDSTTNVIVGASHRRVPVYARDAIGAGARIAGPAIIVELSATAYVAPEFTLRCDDFGNLHFETFPR
jgi:N-methylhydantoinase A